MKDHKEVHKSHFFVNPEVCCNRQFQINSAPAALLLVENISSIVDIN